MNLYACRAYIGDWIIFFNSIFNSILFVFLIKQILIVFLIKQILFVFFFKLKIEPSKAKQISKIS